MNIIKLENEVVKVVNGDARERKENRYSCSEIYSIINGWVTPEEFLKGETFNFNNAFKIWSGQQKHNMIEPLLKSIGYEVEVSQQQKINDSEIILSGRVDAMNEDSILELKTSLEAIGKAKKWSLYQVKLYCTLFKKPTGIIYEPVMRVEMKLNKIGIPKREVTEFYLKEIGIVGLS